MKIGINFHSSDRYISGVEYYSLGLIRNLLRIDNRNEYVVFTNQPSLLADNVPIAENLTIRSLRFLKTRPQRILWEHLALPRIAAEQDLDLLHCPHYICPLRSSTIPYVVTIHDTIAIDHPAWTRTSNAFYYNVSMRRTVRKAAKIIAVSQSTALNLKRNFSVDGPKVQVIHPGIDEIFNTREDPAARARARARYKLPKKYVLFVGNIEPKKNIPALISAYRLLRKKQLPHKLVLTGKRTWKSKTIWNSIRRHVAAGDIVLTGYVERRLLPLVYQMAEVFLFVSHYEGFGLPPLEAMACGTPVAASTAGALAETVPTAACIVDPTDPQSIANAVHCLITDESLRRKHIQRGIEQSRLFSWDIAAKKTLSVYLEATESNV